MQFKNFVMSILLLIFIFTSCSNQEKIDSVFQSLTSDQTGIDFENTLKYDRDFNIYTYRNFYNGGGVAVGDIDGDGLSDLYFSANMGPNKLYKNKGNFQFEDITESASVAGNKSWSTGVTMADIDGDSDLDIYVCNSGDVNGDNKANELFINDGKGRFIEQAAKFGLADQGYSTHAVFFDYDKDGDLDCYLLNNSYQAIGSFNLRDNKRKIRDEKGGDKLLRNDDNRFVDVSREAGIFGSVIGFGLGITVGDINGDSWPDIYVSNDFFERDYIYINNQDGTFSEDLEERMTSISAASMGADMADINNDGNPDIFVTEMLPGQDKRIKTKTTFEDWDKYVYNLENDYYHQFNRNMLQLGGSDHKFTEVGRSMNVHATDWSWGALITDFDNDGWKDLFVANGIYQDLTDQDFLNYIADGDVMKSMVVDSVVDYARLIDAIPSNRIENYMFKNQKGESFVNVAKDWGLAEPSHSNGSAYADLDNDGDLDLVVNNVNMPAFIYKNNSEPKNWIQLELNGEGRNSKAINSKIKVTSSEGTQFFEFMPQKGFQSSMDYLCHVGLGDAELISVTVEWPNESRSIYEDLEVNNRHSLFQKDGKPILNDNSVEKATRFKDISDEIDLGFKHLEDGHVDFDRERLIYNMKSTTGPAVTIEDFNGDGRDDIVFGGSKDSPNELWIQNGSGYFAKKDNRVFEEFKRSETQDLLAMDFDEDGDFDLLSIHGGIEFTRESSDIKDRLFVNDGNGSFTLSKENWPNMGFKSNSVGCKGDFDGDGIQEIFVGEGLKPFAYGVPCDGMIMKKQGKSYVPADNGFALDLKNIGLITDAHVDDLNKDGYDDLIVVGQYMSVEIWYGGKNKMSKASGDLTSITGWWNEVTAADVDNDGDLDIIAGNHGTNSRFKADSLRPVCIHVNDFDRNGSVEQIICVSEGDKAYPLALRHDLVKQLPGLKKKYLKYENYANQTMEDIFTEDQRSRMLTLKANEMRSGVFLNNNGTFQFVPLPNEAQYAPLYAIFPKDVDNDGNVDLLVGGNLFKVKPEVGRYDAMRGLYLKGQGDGSFVVFNSSESGVDVEGEIRAIENISIGDEDAILIARNNNRVVLLDY